MKALQKMQISRQKIVIALLFILAIIAFKQVIADTNLTENIPLNSVTTSDVAVVTAKKLSDYGIAGLTNRVDLTTMVPWDIVQLIEFLAHRGGLNNIVIGKGVAGLTTKLKLSDVTVAEALEIVLSVNNLAYEVKNGIITIMTDEEYRLLNGVSFYDQKKVKLLDLKYADPIRVATMLEKVKSAIGTIVADSVTGTLILIDTPEKIREMQIVVEKADIPTVSRVIPTETKTFVLQYADIEKMQAEISSMLTKEAGSLRADRRTRTLIVTDLPHNMRKIEEVIRIFDQKAKQVFIEAKIVQTTLNDQYSLGIDWNMFMEGLKPRYAVEAISATPAVQTPIGTLRYNTIAAGGDLQAIVEALKHIGKTTILSNPHIAVMDGQEATIEVVTDQPYKEVSLESGTTNITGVTYLFKKVGVQLSVTPRINNEDLVSMSVKPEISSISTWYDGLPQEGTPVIRKSLAETTIMVKNGVTIIIGGMIENSQDTHTYKIPLLGSIPLLGRFFRSDAESKETSEIVVFLTPRIVTGEEPYQRTQEMKKTLKPMRTVGTNLKPVKPVR